VWETCVLVQDADFPVVTPPEQGGDEGESHKGQGEEEVGLHIFKSQRWFTAGACL